MVRKKIKLSFTLQEPNIVVGSLTFEIPIKEKRAFATVLKDMAKVAESAGRNDLANELVAAAKKLDGRGRKPGPKPKTNKKAEKSSGSKAKAKADTSTRISIKAAPVEEVDLSNSEPVDEPEVEAIPPTVEAAESTSEEFDDFS